jgi:hypothetical protein
MMLAGSTIVNEMEFRMSRASEPISPRAPHLAMKMILSQSESSGRAIDQ